VDHADDPLIVNMLIGSDVLAGANGAHAGLAHLVQAMATYQDANPGLISVAAMQAANDPRKMQSRRRCIIE
jgi:hypothetical protein